MLEWKAELIQTCETEARLASLRWQFGFMCSINDFSLIFWVLLPPYALLFSTVVTSDLPRTLASKIRFRAVELNCCQEKRIHSTCQCQPPLASHIAESRNSTQACVHSPRGKFYPLTLTERYFEICLVQIKVLIAWMQSCIPLYLICQSVTLIWVMDISRLLQPIHSQEYGRVLGTLVIILDIRKGCFTVKEGYIERRW